MIRISGESGTDVYRSFTRVYVVFCNWNKPNTWTLYMQVFCIIFFRKCI